MYESKRQNFWKIWVCSITHPTLELQRPSQDDTIGTIGEEKPMILQAPRISRAGVQLLNVVL